MGLEIIVTYTKLVALLASRIVEKMFRMGTIQLAGATQHVLGLPCVDRPSKDLQRLNTDSVNNAVHKEATAWVSASDEDQWEIGGRDLLEEDKQDKQNHEIVYSSSNEDELIELSDGEERPVSITSLLSVKRSHCISSPAKIIRSDSKIVLL